MVRDWIAKIGEGKEAAEQISKKHDQREAEKQKMFESRVGEIRSELANLFYDAIQEFNSTRPQEDKVSCETRPPLVIQAQKTKFPAGYLKIEIDPVTQLLVCHYTYPQKGGFKIEGITLKFLIDLTADDYSFLCTQPNQSLNNEQLLEWVLEPFFQQL